MKPQFSRWLAALLRLGLGAVLVYAGFMKFGAARVITADVVRLQLVPFSWAEWVAAILPMVELLSGVWLITGWRPRAAALAAMLLMTIFVGAVGQATLRGIDFNCHCFGVTADSPPVALVLGRAFALLVCAALLRWIAPLPDASRNQP